MLERLVGLTVQKTYEKIRMYFTEKDCSFLVDEPPEQMILNQGSLWGISPKTAKKTIKLDLEPIGDGTKVVCVSKLASGWKKITLIGCVLAAALLGLCVWMAVDLNIYMSTNNSSVWSWLIGEGGSVNVLAGRAFINLAWEMSVFLLVVIVLEVAIVIYVKFRIDGFAELVLDSLR